MRILYDHQIFESQTIGGISRYIAELIKHNPEAVCSIRYSDNLYLQDPRFAGYRILPKRYEEDRILPGVNFRGKRRIIRKWLQWTGKINKALSIAAIKKGGFDIFHPTYYDPYFLEYLGKKPFVLTVHDMIHELFPVHFSEDHSTSKHKAELIRQAAWITVNSECTRNDLLRFFPEVRDKVSLTYLASSSRIIEAALPKDDYILFTGSRWGYKNFIRFVEAIAPFLLKYDLRLVCTGPDFSLEERTLFEELAITPRVKHHYASEAELSALYSKALLFVFPSLYEGFGIPVLEAMAACCPVVSSNVSSLPEIGGDAAVYFNPRDILDIRTVVDEVITSPSLQGKMITAGKEQIKKFSWEKCAA
jgi:glycosyltransferase involved in cell wall biosynthesis